MYNLMKAVLYLLTLLADGRRTTSDDITLQKHLRFKSALYLRIVVITTAHVNLRPFTIILSTFPAVFSDPRQQFPMSGLSIRLKKNNKLQINSRITLWNRCNFISLYLYISIASHLPLILNNYITT